MTQDTMAERVLKPVDETADNEPMAYKPRTYTRRGLLAAAGAGLVVGAAASTQIDKAAQFISELLSKKPNEVFLGEMEVALNEINLRDEAKRHNVNYGDFQLSKVRKINGKDYKGERILALENVLIVEGSNPENPNDLGPGRWAKIRLEYDGGEVDAYFNVSKKTASAMILRPKQGFAKVTGVDSDSLALDGLAPLRKEQVNITTFKESFTPSK